MKLAYIDLETSGLDPEKCAIIEICCQIETNGREMGEFYCKIRADKDAWIQEEALKVNGVSRIDLEAADRQESAAACKAFLGFLKMHVDPFNKRDKLWFVAYNGGTFDMPFVRAWFKKNGERYFGSYFTWPCHEVAVIAQAALGDQWDDLPNHKLLTVAERFGVQVGSGPLHTAKYDVSLMRGIYNAAGKKLGIRA